MWKSSGSTPFPSTSRGGGSTTVLRVLFQCLPTLPVKKCSLISKLNPPWPNLRLYPLVLLFILCEKRPIPTWLHLPSCQAVVDSDKVCPDPLFFQAEHPQLPQLLFITYVPERFPGLGILMGSTTLCDFQRLFLLLKSLKSLSSRNNPKNSKLG